MSLFPDLPEQCAPAAQAAPIACGCGDPEWFAVHPGTINTAELYPTRSKIVALRADDGEPMVAWCVSCWSKRFGSKSEATAAPP